ncbi:MAG: bifunctional alpha,alpha-trehalose-phosphate synthase (UDP-forming)/trehalose-phosphatase [Candidatus Binatia bacterium]|nr:MAG: bifunctional alpha,alpha-trehalose-phosphate synthase (UDP-forming)/trehalose-phosphatase [Candidatus Binatia bacterium]
MAKKRRENRKGRQRREPAGRIVVVSNRLPFALRATPRGLEWERSPGGLVSALEPVLRKSGGVWIGWPGGEAELGEVAPPPGLAYDIEPVLLGEQELEGYYHGFSNSTLWPLLHSLIERAEFHREHWDAYVGVNRRFADTLCRVAPPDSLVWVHDYHLLLVPRLVRQKRQDLRIAFFLHVPFPSYDVFRLLPWSREILLGILAADLVGFHVVPYVENFLDCVERLLGVRVHREELLVEHGGRSVRVGAFPLGIDFEFYEKMALEAPRARHAGGRRVVLGVDRLDYTKGLPERIRAFERLLELHPEHQGQVVLLQLAVPSRFEVPEYRRLKRQIDELVGRVNGKFGTADWTPIHYLYRTLPPEELAGLYRDADVALVTPLRDGMNLVAKEYVACQVADPGVLVLSRMTGAAETMHEALPVNPYNIDGTAEAIHRALAMGEAERRERLAALRRRERRRNVYAWLDDFLRAAHATSAELAPPSPRDFETWLGPFLVAGEVALFVDYDRCLVEETFGEEEATPSPATLEALRKCVERRDMSVVVLSRRSVVQLRALLGELDVVYAGNHGLDIEGRGIPRFVHQDFEHYARRASRLAERLTEFAPTGSVVEYHGPNLAFRCSGVDAALAAQALARARQAIVEAGFLVREFPGIVEALPPVSWHRGNSVLHVVRALYGPAWTERALVVYVGAHETDEEAFRLLGGLGVSFCVGIAEDLTQAMRRLANVEGVRALLEWLAERGVENHACA